MQFDDDEPLRIYHEHQSSQLCARHCLNNLLQGPYFTEFDLSKIALDLDKEEQALLAQDGDENNGLIEWLKTNQQSQNVSDDGNFSIQVLRRALDNLSLRILHFGGDQTKDAQQHPEKEVGFICNLQAHWFAIRRIGGVWYNLNSLSGLPETKAIPTTISNFYLSAFLSTLSNDSYSIFVVQSDKWPHLHSYDPQQHLPPYCKWRLAKDIKPRSETYPKHLLEQVNKSLNGQHVTSLGWGSNGQQMSNDEMLQYALQQSMGGGNNNNNAMYSDMGMGNADDPELAHALALSMKHHGITGDKEEMDVEDDEDALMQKALAMSMEQEDKGNNEESANQNQDLELQIVEEPDEKESDVVIIQLRMPKNIKIERRFKQENKLNDVSNFVKSKDSSFNDIIFVCPPANSYNDMDMTLDVICKELKSDKLAFIVKENQNKKEEKVKK